MVMEGGDQVVSELLLEWRCDGHEEGGPGCVRSPIRVEM